MLQPLSLLYHMDRLRCRLNILQLVRLRLINSDWGGSFVSRDEDMAVISLQYWTLFLNVVLIAQKWLPGFIMFKLWERQGKNNHPHVDKTWILSLKYQSKHRSSSGLCSRTNSLFPSLMKTGPGTWKCIIYYSESCEKFPGVVES